MENTHNLADVIALANEQVALEKKIEELEETLKETKEEHRKVSQDLLPNLMEQIGLPSFTTPEGATIEIKEEIGAHISVERQKPANDWLESHGHGGLIKSEVKVSFGRDEIEKANELVRKLQREGLVSQLERKVHASTLKAFVREQLMEGTDIPVDVFGITRQPTSKVTFKKRKRSKKENE